MKPLIFRRQRLPPKNQIKIITSPAVPDGWVLMTSTNVQPSEPFLDTQNRIAYIHPSMLKHMPNKQESIRLKRRLKFKHIAKNESRLSDYTREDTARELDHIWRELRELSLSGQVPVKIIISEDFYRDVLKLPNLHTIMESKTGTAPTHLFGIELQTAESRHRSIKSFIILTMSDITLNRYTPYREGNPNQ